MRKHFPSPSLREKRLLFQEFTVKRLPPADGPEANDAAAESAAESNEGQDEGPGKKKTELITGLQKFLQHAGEVGKGSKEGQEAVSAINKAITAIGTLEGDISQENIASVLPALTAACQEFGDVLAASSEYASMSAAEKNVAIGNHLKREFGRSFLKISYKDGKVAVAAKPVPKSRSTGPSEGGGDAVAAASEGSESPEQTLGKIKESLSKKMGPEEIKAALGGASEKTQRGQTILVFLNSALGAGLEKQKALALVQMPTQDLDALGESFARGTLDHTTLTSESVVRELSKVSAKGTEIFIKTFLSHLPAEQQKALAENIARGREAIAASAPGANGVFGQLGDALKDIIKNIQPFLEQLKVAFKEMQPYIKWWNDSKEELRIIAEGGDPNAPRETNFRDHLDKVASGEPQDIKNFKGQHQRLQEQQKSIRESLDGKTARDKTKLKTGVKTAETSVENARKKVDSLVAAGKKPEEITLAEKQLDLAERNLAAKKEELATFEDLLKQKEQVEKDMKLVMDTAKKYDIALDGKADESVADAGGDSGPRIGGKPVGGPSMGAESPADDPSGPSTIKRAEAAANIRDAIADMPDDDIAAVEKALKNSGWQSVHGGKAKMIFSADNQIWLIATQDFSQNGKNAQAGIACQYLHLRGDEYNSYTWTDAQEGHYYNAEKKEVVPIPLYNNPESRDKQYTFNTDKIVWEKRTVNERVKTMQLSASMKHSIIDSANGHVSAEYDAFSPEQKTEYPLSVYKFDEGAEGEAGTVTIENIKTQGQHIYEWYTSAAAKNSMNAVEHSDGSVTFTPTKGWWIGFADSVGVELILPHEVAASSGQKATKETKANNALSQEVAKKATKEDQETLSENLATVRNEHNALGKLMKTIEGKNFDLSKYNQTEDGVSQMKTDLIAELSRHGDAEGPVVALWNGILVENTAVTGARNWNDAIPGGENFRSLIYNNPAAALQVIANIDQSRSWSTQIKRVATTASGSYTDYLNTRVESA